MLFLRKLQNIQSAQVILTVILLTGCNKLLADESVRCNGSLISRGELRIKVLNKCGEPTDRVDYTRHAFVHTKLINYPKKKITRLVERFSINYTDSILFQNELEEFEKKNHSHDEITSLFANNDKSIIKGDRFVKRRDIFNENLLNNFTTGKVVWRCEKHEEQISEWIYNLGPQQFIRIITFSNGRVIKIETKDYGF